MSPVLLLLGLLAIFAALVLVLAAAGVFSTRETGVARSLAAVEAISLAPDTMRADLDKPFGERVVTPVRAWLARLAGRLAPSDQGNRLRRSLDLAGNPAGWDVERVLAFKVIGAVVVAVLVFAVLTLFGNLTWAVVLGIGGLVLGFFLPNIVLYQVAYNRSDRIRRDLPDSLDLLTISVEAGLGFDAALAQVARNTEGPLAEEFFRVLQEMQIGTGRSAAMRSLSERTDVEDLRVFVNSMVQADSFGIPVADVLRVQAHEMRLKRSQRAEEQAQKVPVKLLFPLIFCILPALFIVILGPAVITIIENFSEATS